MKILANSTLVTGRRYMGQHVRTWSSPAVKTRACMRRLWHPGSMGLAPVIPVPCSSAARPYSSGVMEPQEVSCDQGKGRSTMPRLYILPWRPHVFPSLNEGWCYVQSNTISYCFSNVQSHRDAKDCVGNRANNIVIICTVSGGSWKYRGAFCKVYDCLPAMLYTWN